MAVILFFIVLAVLILSHELGHFLAAKRAGIRVDEFAFGFPPQLFSFKKGETIYAFNLFPIGGYVKISGENGEDMNDPCSFSSKSASKKAMVIVAGVFFNILLAWFLYTVGFMIGLPSSTGSVPAGARISNTKIVLIEIVKGSPAEKAGLKTGDEILGFSTVKDLQNLIKEKAGMEMEINYKRDDKNFSAKLTPRINPPAGEGAIGIAMDEVGILKMPWYLAPWEGLKTTYYNIIAIFSAFYNLIAGAIRGLVGLDALTGPVGIVGIAGSAAKMGLPYFLSFIAFLSINLAVINILPFPALDGGRLLFILIEKIKGSPINQKFTGWAHGIGMAILLLLMLIITYRDIVRLL